MSSLHDLKYGKEYFPTFQCADRGGKEQHCSDNNDHDGGTVEISLEDENIIIVARDVRTSLNCSATRQPDESRFASFPAAVFREMIMKTRHAMWRDDRQDVFNGLYLRTVKNFLIVVATDGRRLSKIRRKLPNPLPFRDGVVIPAKAIEKLMRLLDTSEEASVSSDERANRVHFRVGNVNLICEIIDGEFPDYEQVIPAKLDHRIRFNRIALQKAIRQAASQAIRPARQVHLKFTSGKVSFKAGTPDVGGSESILDCEYDGPEMVLAFNSGYVMDVLRVIRSEDVELGFSSPDSPAVISDPQDSEFIAVVMPMKMQG